MKLFRRFTSLLLVFTMVFTMSLPSSVFADDTAADESNTSASGDQSSDSGMGPGGEGAMANAGDSAPDTAAIYVSDGAEVTDNEYSAGAYSDLITTEDGLVTISNLNLTDGDYSFNGLVATGEGTTVRLEDSTIDLSVDSAASSDADGGSAVAVDDGATLYVSDSDLTVDGAGRYVTSAYNDATLIVNDSTVTSTGSNDNTTEISDPRSNAALLISGSARANFSVGATSTYYFNSVVTAEGWAALSTDSATGNGLDLYAYGTTAIAQNGGYGTYADTNCRVWLYGSDLEAAEIGAIISKTGQITADDGADAPEEVTAYNEGESTEDETTIAGGRNAVMMHAPDMMGEGASAASTGVLDLSDTNLITTTDLESTTDYTETYGEAIGAYVDYISGADILVKSTSTDIDLDNVDMESYSGVLVETVLNSDSMGNFLDEEDGATVDPVDVNMENMEVAGDILHMDYQRRMTLSLDDTTLTGEVVSGTYEDWTELWADYADQDVNWLPDDSWDTVYGVSMTLSGESVWNPTGESSLTSLTVEDDAVINGTVYVDGVETEIEAGTTYEGDIEVVGNNIYGDTITETTEYENGVNILEAPVTAVGYLLTMTVDGVETEIEEGSYDGDVIFTVTAQLSESALGSYTARGQDNYRTALYVNDGAYSSETSVLAALAKNKRFSLSGNLLKNFSITSTSDDFTGIIVKDTDSYEIKNGTIVMDSDYDGSTEADTDTSNNVSTVSDFAGLGAGISIYGDSVVEVDNVDVTTTGVAKLAVMVDDGADAIITDSTLRANGGEMCDEYQSTADQTKMVSPPWVLGIGGNARTTNLMGDYTTSTYIDSTISAEGWGALSTDACSKVTLTAINCDVEVDDTGYGTYAIGSAIENFYGVTFDTATYVTISAGGTMTYQSYTEDQEVDIVKADDDATEVATVSSDEVDGTVNTTATSEFGVMFHTAGGTVNMLDGTYFDLEDAAFLAKAGDVVVNIDDSDIDSDTGVIFQAMDNDDSDVGVTMPSGYNGPVFNTVYTEDEGWSGSWDDDDQTQQRYTDTVNLTNVELDGDYFNGSGYTQSASTLTVNIGDDATVNGAISATEVMHYYDGEQSTSFTSDEYYKMGHVINTAYYNGINDVTVNVTDDGVWNVTDTSILTSLTIGEDATVNATAYYLDSVDAATGEVTYGDEIELEAGETYGSTDQPIVLVEKEEEEEEESQPQPIQPENPWAFQPSVPFMPNMGWGCQKTPFQNVQWNGWGFQKTPVQTAQWNVWGCQKTCVQTAQRGCQQIFQAVQNLLQNKNLQTAQVQQVACNVRNGFR